jgi:hypothetical protein
MRGKIPRITAPLRLKSQPGKAPARMTERIG